MIRMGASPAPTELQNACSICQQDGIAAGSSRGRSNTPPRSSMAGLQHLELINFKQGHGFAAF